MYPCDRVLIHARLSLSPSFSLFSFLFFSFFFPVCFLLVKTFACGPFRSISRVLSAMCYTLAVEPPASHRLTVAEVFANGLPNDTLLRNHFAKEGRVTEECALRIIAEASKILRAEDTLIKVPAPVTGPLRVHTA